MRDLARRLPLACVLLTGCISPADTPPDDGPYVLVQYGESFARFDVPISHFPSTPSGWVAFELSGSTSVSLVGALEYSWSSARFNPVQLLLVRDGGPVETLVGHLEYDGSQNGGEDAVYVGGPDRTVRSPNLSETSAPSYKVDVLHFTNATRAILFLTWVDSSDPPRLDLLALEGTVVTRVDDGLIQAHDFATFRDGVRAGTPVLRGSAGDSLVFPARLHPFGYVKYFRAGAGRGEIVFTGGVVASIDLGGDTPTCASCFEEGAFLFASDADVRVRLDYAGYSRTTKVYLVVAETESPFFHGGSWIEIPQPQGP